MVSFKTMLTMAAVGVLLSTPAFAQTGAAGGAASTPGVGTPGTTTPGGGLTPSIPPAPGPTLDPSASPAPPRPTQSTPTPGLDNPTGANTPSGMGSSSGIGGTTTGAPGAPITTPLPQGGTAPSTTPGGTSIQR